jgi:hypothetical protein
MVYGFKLEKPRLLAWAFFYLKEKEYKVIEIN